MKAKRLINLMIVLAIALGMVLAAGLLTMDRAAAENIVSEQGGDATGTPVRIVWQDGNDEDKLRPNSVELIVYSDDFIPASLTLTADGDWSGSVNGDVMRIVPNWGLVIIAEDYEYGRDTSGQYRYGIEHEKNDGYTVRMIHTPQVTTSAEIMIVWDDGDNADGLRPESLHVTLSDYEDNDPLIEGPGWGGYQIGNLPKYGNGNEIEYTWTVTDMPKGYRLTKTEVKDYITFLTLTHDIEKVELTVKIIWDDDNDRDIKRPEELKFRLDGNDGRPELSGDITLRKSEGWESTQSIGKNYAGKPISYKWIQKELPEGYQLTGTSVDGNVTTVTNSYTPEQTEATVNIVWDDEENKDKKRPDSLTVTLLANGKATDRKATLNKNSWTATLEKLPKNENGSEIKYTFSESEPDWFAVTGTATEGNTTTLTNTIRYQVVFDPGEGGAGSMESQAVIKGQTFTFPECTLDPPAEMTFDHWEMSGVDGICYPGDTTVTAGNCATEGVITVTARWKKGPPAVITTAPEGKTAIYDGNALALVTAGAAENGAVYYAVGSSSTDVPTEGWSPEIPAGTSAGTRYVWYKAVGNRDYSNSNAGCCRSEIKKRSVVATVTAVDRDYEAGNLSVSLTAGAVAEAAAGDDLTADVSAASGTIADDCAGTNKAVTVTGVKLGGTSAGNYELSAQPAGVTVTISKAGPAVTAPIAKEGLVYTGAAQALVTAGTADGGTLLYAVTTANTAPAADQYSEAIPTGKEAKNYYVWYKVAGGDNYEDVDPASIQAAVHEVDKEALNEMIGDAEEYLDSIKDKYPDIAGKLNDEIKAAKEISENPGVTADETADETKKLGDALDEAKKAVKDADDKAAADTAADLIDTLPKPEDVTPDDKDDIKAARKAYDDLTDDQKKLVPEDVVKKLADDEKALEDAIKQAEKEKADKDAADAVIDQINALPKPEDVTPDDKDDIEAARKAYDDLTDDQKKLVPEDVVKKLADDEKALEDAIKQADKEKADKDAADAVIDKINALPKPEDVTPDDKDDIEDSRKAYDDLTDDQKKLVPEDVVKKLTGDEKALEDAVKQAEKEKADKDAADAVIDQINALPKPEDVTPDDKDDIEDARKAYDDLTDDQKKLVPEDVVKKLTGDEKALEDAIKQAEKEKTDPAVTAPKGKEGLVASGQAQALVEAGSATGGTMKYTVSTKKTQMSEDWTEAIPTGTEAGTYYVWYKVFGDETHNDTAPACVEVTIKAAPEPEPEPEPDSGEPEPPVKDKLTRFLERCYSVILGREADEEGLAWWKEQIASGNLKASDVVLSFMSGKEFAGRNCSNKQIVGILYRVMLNRQADEEGLAYWVGQLEGGESLAVIINGICPTEEFEYVMKEDEVPGSTLLTPDGKTDVAAIQAFMKRCYTLILGREAETDGLNYWTEELRSGRATAAEVIHLFMHSGEFTGKNLSHGEKVTILYRTMLNRLPDEAGKAFWVGLLQGGDPIAKVINGFCESKEFTGICRSYGIAAGRVRVY